MLLQNDSTGQCSLDVNHACAKYYTRIPRSPPIGRPWLCLILVGRLSWRQFGRPIVSDNAVASTLGLNFDPVQLFGQIAAHLDIGQVVIHVEYKMTEVLINGLNLGFFINIEGKAQVLYCT